MATKIEAFYGRGKDDFLGSHDKVHLYISNFDQTESFIIIAAGLAQGTRRRRRLKIKSSSAFRFVNSEDTTSGFPKKIDISTYQGTQPERPAFICVVIPVGF